MIADAREIRAYFAPSISETTFAGILAAVNGQRLIILSLAEHIAKVCAKVKTIVKVNVKKKTDISAGPLHFALCRHIFRYPVSCGCQQEWLSC